MSLRLAVCLGGLLLPWAIAHAADWRSRPLSEIAIHPEERVPATVDAADEARLASEVAGRIVRLPVRVGEPVAPGSELVRLDDRQYRVEVERSAAQLAVLERRLELAAAQLAQAESLAARQFLSPEALRIRQTEAAVLAAERDAARAGLAQARLALERTVLRAPFAGVVRERAASVGDLAAPGTPLLTLAALGPVELRARVPADRVDSLRAAGAWTLVAGARTVPLELRRVSPLVERAGQTREAVFVARGGAALSPGLAGEVRWKSARPHLPPAYVQTRDGVNGAYVAEGGRAVFRPLPHAEAGRPAPVDWPLTTPVVDEGRFALGRDGRNAP